MDCLSKTISLFTLKDNAAVSYSHAICSSHIEAGAWNLFNLLSKAWS